MIAFSRKITFFAFFPKTEKNGQKKKNSCCIKRMNKLSRRLITFSNQKQKEQGYEKIIIGKSLRKPLRVGDEWWISDFYADCIHRLDGNFHPLSPVCGKDIHGPRGMCCLGEEVLVCCFYQNRGWVARISSRRGSQMGGL